MSGKDVSFEDKKIKKIKNFYKNKKVTKIDDIDVNHMVQKILSNTLLDTMIIVIRPLWIKLPQMIF